MKITKIVSGGQTGADRGGWEAAIYCELPIGGWIPKSRKAEDGAIPAKYTGLKQVASAKLLASSLSDLGAKGRCLWRADLGVPPFAWVMANPPWVFGLRERATRADNE